MNKGLKTVLTLGLICGSVLGLSSCNRAMTAEHNLQVDADQFKVRRRMTFINLYTDKVLYVAEGRFSVRTTYSNEYQGQQEVGILFKTAENKFKMDYFSIANNITYVVEQLELSDINDYSWSIRWYVPIPDNQLG